MIKTTNFSNYIQCFHQVEQTISLLALGCGKLVMEKLIQPKIILAVDWADDILRLHIGDPTVIPMKADITDVCRLFPEGSFGTVTLFDVLEHLTKEDALSLLKQVERVCSGQIVLFIPIEDDTVTDKERENYKKLQQGLKDSGKQLGYHLSKWTVTELEELGFVGEYSERYHKNSKYPIQRGWGACFCVKKIKK